MEVSFKSRKLRNSIKRLTDKAKNQDLDLESLSVYGVTKESGVIVTGKEVGKNLGEYYYFSGQKIAYNPYRANIGSIGLTKSDFRGLMSPAYVIFEVDDTIYPEFLLLYLKSDIGQRLIKWYGDRGGIRSSLRISDLGKIDFPDITYEDQKGFYDDYLDKKIKIDELLNELSFQQELLDNLRQSIIQKAIKGKLTEKWRRTNLSIESGVELVNRINASKERALKVEKSLPIVTTEEVPFDIPKTWKWERLGNIKDPEKSISYGVIVPGPNVSDGIPLIRVSDLEFAGTGKQPEKSISKEISLKHKKTIIDGNEILITVVGSTIGKTVISDANWKGANIARAIARLKIHEFLETEYFNLVLTSPYIQSLFTNASKTIGQPTLNIGFIENTLVPVPPLEEQKVIIERITQFQRDCKEFEVEIIDSKENSEKLVQSILYDLLGEKKNILINKMQAEEIKEIPSRKKKYNSKTTFMELVDLLKEHGKLHAEDLWKMSKYFDNKNIGDSIDKFYADLKKKIEIDKTVKEVENEKGYLELV